MTQTEDVVCGVMGVMDWPSRNDVKKELQKMNKKENVGETQTYSQQRSVVGCVVGRVGWLVRSDGLQVVWARLVGLCPEVQQNDIGMSSQKKILW